VGLGVFQEGDRIRPEAGGVHRQCIRDKQTGIGRLQAGQRLVAAVIGGRVIQSGAFDVEIEGRDAVLVDDALIDRLEGGHASHADGQFIARCATEGNDDVSACAAKVGDGGSDGRIRSDG